MDLLHVIPVIMLREDEGQHHGEDEGDEQTEASTSQCGANLLQGCGGQLTKLQVSLRQPCSHAHELPSKCSCTSTIKLGPVVC